MTAELWIVAGLPIVAAALGVFATYAGPLGAYLKERTHNAQLERIVNAAGRLAAGVADTLRAQPAGVDLASLREALLRSATSTIKAEFVGSIEKLGASTDAVKGIVTNELAKIPGVNSVGAVVVPDAATAAPTEPVAPPPVAAPAILTP